MKVLILSLVINTISYASPHPSFYEPSKFDAINSIYDFLMQANSGLGFNASVVNQGYDQIVQDESTFFTFSESLLGHQRAMFGDYIEFLNRSKNTDAIFLESEMNTRITISIYKDVVSFLAPRGDREIFVEDYSSKAEPLAHLLPRMSDAQYEWFRTRLVDDFLLNRSASKRILKLKLEFIGMNAVQNAFKSAVEMGFDENQTQEYVTQEKLKAETAAIKNTVYLIDPLLMEALMLTSTRHFYGTRSQQELGYIRTQEILKEVVEVDKTPEAYFLRQIIANFKAPQTCLAFFK